jgi:hypothetical protein
MQRMSIVMLSIIAMLSIMDCTFTQNHDRFGTGYGHKGKTADTVEIGLPPYPAETIADKEVPPPPAPFGQVVKNVHCRGDSIQFFLAESIMTIAIDDLVFLYHLGVKGKPQLNTEKALFGTRYTYTVYCRNWGQKKHFFPCVAY